MPACLPDRQNDDVNDRNAIYTDATDQPTARPPYLYTKYANWFIDIGFYFNVTILSK